MPCTRALGVLLITYALQLAALPVAALGPDAAGVLATLQHFDQEVQQGLRALAAAAESPNVEAPPDLADEAAALLDGVRDLEVAAQALPEADRAFVLAKVRSVRWQAEELARLTTQAATRESEVDDPAGSLWPYPNQVQLPADHCEDAPAIGLGSFTGTTEGADAGGAEASCGASYDAPDVWYRFVVPEGEADRYYLTTIGSQFDTVLSIYSGCPGLLTNQRTCDDDTYGLQSGVTLYAPRAGDEHLVRISGVIDASGPFQLNVTTGGTVTGTVLDETTGLPIPSIRMRLSGPWTFVVTTDALGRFTFAGLPEGRYLLRSGDETDEYVDEYYPDQPCYGPLAANGCSIDGAVRLEVRPEAYPPLTVRLARGGTLSGRIYDPETGEDLAGSVVFYGEDRLQLASITTPGSWTWTEAPPTRLYVAGRAAGRRTVLFGGGTCFPCDFDAAVPVQVEPGTALGGIDLGPPLLGSVAGRVTAAATGHPVANATVDLRRLDGTYVASARTAGDGTYRLSASNDGSYLVLVRSTCYRGELYDDIPCALLSSGDLSCAASDGVPVAIGVGLPPPVADFSLTPFGGISGSVRDASSGEPISGATVTVLPSSGWASTVTTGADGLWSVTCLSASSAQVVVPYAPGHVGELYPDVSCPDWDCDLSQGAEIPIPPDAPPTGIDFALGVGGAIEGTIRDEVTLDPLPYVTVRLTGPTGQTRATVRTDASGLYRADSLAPEPHYASTERAQGYLREIYDDIVCPGSTSWCTPLMGTPIPVIEGDTTSDVDFGLRPGARLSGRVSLWNGEPASARVEVFHDLGQRFGTTYSHDGTWSVSGLPAGSYYAVASRWNCVTQVYSGHDCPPGVSQACSPLLGTTIPVGTAEHRTGIDFVLHQFGRLEGTVAATDYSTGDVVILALDGTVVKRVRPWREHQYSTWSSDLPPGEYVLWLEPSALYLGEVHPGFPCEDAACALAHGVPVALALDQVVTGLAFTPDLRPVGGLSGTVMDAATGQLLPGVRVEIMSTDGVYVGEAGTLADGLFDRGGLRPGLYLLRAKATGYITQLLGGVDCWPAECPATAGNPVEVVAGETRRHLDFQLRPRPRLGISGSITVARHAVRGTATLYDVSGELVASQSVDPDFGYSFTDLRPGTYFVAASSNWNSLGVRREVYRDTPCAEGACPEVATPVELSEASGSAGGIDFVLETPPTATGTIRTHDDQPLAGVVRGFDEEGEEILHYTTSSSGGFSIPLPLDQTLFLEASANGFRPEVYREMPPGTAPTEGTPLTATWGERLTGLDFTLDALPRITGTVRTDLGEPVTGVVRLLDPSGDEVRSRWVSGGSFQITVEPGTYYVVASSSTTDSVLFPGVVCSEPAPAGCDLSLGETITLGVNQTIQDLELILPDRRGVLRLAVVDGHSGIPIEAAAMLYQDSGSTISTSHSPTQPYEAHLVEGTYYLKISATSYLDELYEDIICEYTCTPTLGTALVIQRGETVDLGVLDLEPGYVGFLGRVTAPDGSPIEFVLIDAWRADDLSHADTAVTDAHGVFRLPIGAGAYYFSTDAGGGWIDQAHPGISCPDGPAWTGDCDVTLGTPLEAAAIFPTQVDFVLSSRFDIFADGFDDGTLAAWTVTP